MEPIKGDDLDCFLVRMEQKFQRKKETKSALEESDFGLGFAVQMPGEFELADEKTAAEIFWTEKRPSILLLTSDQKAGITFFTIQGEGKQVEIETYQQRIKEVLDKTDDRTVFYDKGNVEERILWLEYKSFASEECLYNLTFFFSAAGRIVIGNFYCLFEKYDKWKPVIFEMFHTIRTEET